MCCLSGSTFFFGMHTIGKKCIPMPSEKGCIFQTHALLQSCDKRNLPPQSCEPCAGASSYLLWVKDPESLGPSFLQQQDYEVSGTADPSETAVLIWNSDKHISFPVPGPRVIPSTTTSL